VLVTALVCTLFAVQATLSVARFAGAVHASRGTTASDAHRADLAREAFRRANTVYPPDASWWYAEAGFTMAVYGPAFALPLYEAALARAPYSAQNLTAVAEQRALQGDLDGTKALLERLKTVAPFRAEGYAVRGLVASLDGRHEDAITEIDRALDLLASPNPAWQAMKASEELAAGRYGAAVESMDKALAAHPLRPQYRFVRGLALLELGEYARARDDLGWALRAYTERIAGGDSAARSLARRARIGVTRSDLGQGRYASAFEELATLFGTASEGELKRLARDLMRVPERALRRWEDDWRALAADILIDLGEFDGARGVLASADEPGKATGDEPVWALATRARLATAAGAPERAIERIRMSGTSARSDVRVRFALAEAEAALGRFASARLEWASIVRDRNAPGYMKRRAGARYEAIAAQ